VLSASFILATYDPTVDYEICAAHGRLGFRPKQDEAQSWQQRPEETHG